MLGVTRSALENNKRGSGSGEGNKANSLMPGGLPIPTALRKGEKKKDGLPSIGLTISTHCDVAVILSKKEDAKGNGYM